MKILIVRHGDPDYEHDSLTERGWQEAKLLAERFKKIDVRDFYVSPLGRAKDTASFTLQNAGKTATECWWLREFFVPQIHRPDIPADRTTIAWDWLPQDWTACPELYDRKLWKENPIMKEGRVGEQYDEICAEFDKLIASYGYVREGDIYRTEQGNCDTIALFCHFGLGALLVSHLTNVSPMIMWQNFCYAPTSVTTVATEERRKGTAAFRVISFGDTSHLYAGDTEPAFAGRFREIYENDWERLD